LVPPQRGQLLARRKLSVSTARYGRGWGWRQGETNDMKADWRERMGALQASRWPFDSVVEEREVELDLLRRLSAFAQRFFCRSRNPCPGRCHSNFTWIENAFPATARVQCSSVKGRRKLPSYFRNPHAQLKIGSASPKTGVRRTALSPKPSLSGLLRPARGLSLFR
jgi:hypothetical protein